MAQNDFEIIKVISEVIDIDENDLHVETEPKNIEQWDSVNNLRIYSHLVNYFNKDIPFKEYLKAKNISELEKLFNG
ncbi:hypothetical protein EKS17_03385 [Streptococcus mutans]|uniref:hypothetical protein n=1 Tax=Streptococcus mutans TaxID=1309 RepID=UPI0002B5B3B7|nr:hypothetical protein [Streptococcus mutans]EMB77235.1 hypothetical protein SMU50_08806 [Streptococcus mutans 5SM3]EMB84803.1 hypothetical protein SMU56_09410 [Streptococcus mutans N29]EMB88350.1 hypothetical protein SMU57_07648 [Streptococcus mutans NMT4863]MCB4979138.1 hypothetical protein [Streptococcus mutans]MCB5052364.1 hypothetical protein [Streptococcus mutans]